MCISNEQTYVTRCIVVIIGIVMCVCVCCIHSSDKYYANVRQIHAQICIRKQVNVELNEYSRDFIFLEK
jgi:hypothetical protein